MDVAPTHSQQHSNLNDAMAALQVKVGINGSPDPNSLDYKVAQLVAMLMNPNANVRIQNNQLQLWDSGQNAFVPLTCVNGQLGVGRAVA